MISIHSLNLASHKLSDLFIHSNLTNYLISTTYVLPKYIWKVLLLYVEPAKPAFLRLFVDRLVVGGLWCGGRRGCPVGGGGVFGGVAVEKLLDCGLTGSRHVKLLGLKGRLIQYLEMEILLEV